MFGKIAGAYFQKYGDQSDALAMIAAKNHKNGVGNPYAQMRKDFGYDFCRNASDKNPFVAGPLKRTDCSLVSDGAAAVVLADVETALQMKKAVAFRAAQHVQDFLPMAKRDILKFEGCTHAWQRALAQAGIALADLSFVETHDCFTIAELIEYEAMGLTPEGQGARAIKDGITQKDGRLPVNPSGGLKAKGHPIGATGVSMHALAAMQLTGTAGDIQVEGREARRHLQHGRRGGRELRQDFVPVHCHCCAHVCHNAAWSRRLNKPSRRSRNLPMPIRSRSRLRGNERIVLQRWWVNSRVRDSIEPPDDGCGDQGASQEVSGELVVAGGDAAEVLEPANMRSIRLR